MTKKLFSFFFALAALLIGALYFTNTIQSPFISALNSTKLNYHNTIEYMYSYIFRHFAQAEHIEELEAKLKEYENNHLIMRELATELNDLFVENNSSFKVYPEVKLVRTISYQRFNDQNRIWLEVEDYNSSRVYGLTHKELVAGIVVAHNNKPLGILNRDIKCSYSVLIGSGEVPGIAHGNNSKELIVKYIPGWHTIKKGDEVVTSGLDGLFFKGLKVGKVISISRAQGYQNATIVPYYNSNNPNYFHMIKKIK
jgi:rod shape-determining protein MreC